MVKLLRIGAILVLIVLLSTQIFSQDGRLPRYKQSEGKPYTFTVNVGLVVLPVTVLDKSGRCVSGLAEKDFTIYEDGVQQSIELFDQKDTPVSVGLVIDASSSMAPKHSEVVAAALELAESSNPADQIFVIRFHELVAFALRLGEAFTSNIDELRSAVSSISGTGRTALYDAVISGLEHIGLSDLTRRVLVIISDGGDNASRHTLQETLDMAAKSSAQVYSIGIYDEYDLERNPKVLKRLAKITGGEAFFPKNVSQLPEICKHIAADIRTQYTLGYIPSSKSSAGSYRSIRVSVRAANMGRLTVRTRPGYLAPGR